MRIRAVIVDDEPLARESLRLLLSRHDGVEIVGEASHGEEALPLIRREEPDLLFVDVQMPGVSGIELLRRLGPIDTMAVVFVTAFDEYAMQAFESRALDYLLKPYTDERFEQVLARAIGHIKDKALSRIGARVVDLLAGHEPGDRRTLAVREGQKTIFVPVADIEWIEADDYYVRVHAGGRAHLLRESLRSLEKTLDPARFVRVHRGAIVNRDRVAALETQPSGDAVAVLRSGGRVRVSRTFRSSLLPPGSLHPASSG